ncbi:unnamed protein product [Echinostoma caproni]|uniref:C-CAP/cofactor C-like domain-containing protein n=1 Tax=Echinostoma caproni TaxID=27848 RepID=A0A183A6X8_9TREM|nr:unnamed protein product [Echinostoma caproni]
MMSSTPCEGDNSTVLTGPRSAREALFSRMAERHAQTKAAQLSRRNQDRGECDLNDDAGSGLKSKKQCDFLPKFLQTKAEILADLDEAIQQRQMDALSMPDLTKILDDTLVRIEDLQKRLNEYSLYLTPFDCEQATQELKNLQIQFQAKREELLPSQKFKFSRNRVKKSTGTAASDVTVPGVIERSNPIPGKLTKYDERFSLVNIQHNPHLLLPKPNCTDAIGPDHSVYLAELTNCTVQVRDVCGNLVAKRLRNCRVYIFPVAGSVWLEDCQQCDFVVACRQLRIHQTTDSRLGLHMASRPIIEHSTGLRVAPYPLHYPTLDSDLIRAGLSAEVNLWREVEDFSHPNKRLTTGSPNWSVLPETEWDTLKPPTE